MSSNLRASPFAIIPVEAALDHRLTAMQYRVLIAILSFRSRNSDTVYPRRELIAQRCGYSVNTVSRVTRLLVDFGWLVKTGRGGRSRATEYQVTVPDELPETLPGFGVIEPDKTVADPETVSDPATVSGQDTVSDEKRWPTRTQNGGRPGKGQGRDQEHISLSRTRAREAVDNSEGREIRFGDGAFDVSAAPESLTDDEIHQLLSWQAERDPKWSPGSEGVQATMREIAKAAEAGWDPREAIGIWQQAGWSTFRADYLDRMKPQQSQPSGPGPCEELREQAWATVKRACKDGKTTTDVRQEDTAIGRAVEMLGGMSHLRLLKERDLDRLRTQFVELYGREFSKIQARQQKAAAGGA